jgi:hypothetical protein
LLSDSRVAPHTATMRVTNIYLPGDSVESISTFIRLMNLKKPVMNDDEVDGPIDTESFPSTEAVNLIVMEGEETSNSIAPSIDDTNYQKVSKSIHEFQGHMVPYEYNYDANKTIVFHTVIFSQIEDSWSNLFERTQIHGFVYLDESNGQGNILMFQTSFADWYDVSYCSFGRKPSLPIVCFRMKKNNSDYKLGIEGPFLTRFLILREDSESNENNITIIKKVSKFNHI